MSFKLKIEGGMQLNVAANYSHFDPKQKAFCEGDDFIEY